MNEKQDAVASIAWPDVVMLAIIVGGLCFAGWCYSKYWR